ncbi:hypothetical protein AVEN_216007-1, partial [Araneus ventricosus]
FLVVPVTLKLLEPQAIYEGAVAWWSGGGLGAGGFPDLKPDSTEDPQYIEPVACKKGSNDLPVRNFGKEGDS